MLGRRALWSSLLLLPLWGQAAFSEVTVATSRGPSFSEEFLHRAWTREQGLPDEKVQAIAQTPDGYLWVATSRGVARFDGIEFAAFTRANTPDMQSEDCQALAVDSSGVLWVGTAAGMLRRTGRTFKSVEVASHTRDLHLLAAERSSGVWAACADEKSLYHLGSSGVVYTRHFESGTAGHITCVAEMPDGRTWIGGATGAYWLEDASGRLEPVAGLPQVNQPWDHRVAFSVTGSEYHLLGSLHPDRAQLYRVDKGAWTLCATNVLSNNGRPFFLVGSKNGDLWFPDGEAGLFRYSPSQSRLAAISLPFDDGDVVLSLCEDREGNLWVGTESSGLHRLQPRKIEVLTRAHGLAGRNPECVLQAQDGTIWVGTENGLSRIGPEGCRTFSERDGLARNIVRALAEDREGTVWIGTLGGLNYFRDGSLARFTFPGDWAEGKVRAILPADGGGVWVGTARGLHWIQGGYDQKFTTADGLSANEVLALLGGPAGSLWVGTLGGGVNQLIWPTERTQGHALIPPVVHVLSTTNGLSSNVIRALHQDCDGVLWIATDEGLNRYAQGAVQVFTRRDGLPDSQINDLLEDDAGQFWIGYDRGMYRVKRQSLNDVAQGRSRGLSVVNYDLEDGLIGLEASGQFSQPASARMRDGRLWFCTSRGISIFDPKRLPDCTNAPAVVIQRVRANGRLILDDGPGGADTTATQRPLDLPAGSARNLEFHYTANSFVSPDHARFRYRLNGWDKEWIEAGQGRDAYYANLHPGRYTFHVIAANKHGVESQQMASLDFIIRPFVYQSWSFYIACFSGLALSGFLVVRWRLSELGRLQALQQQIALDTQRRRIARDIHDELGACLTQIAQLSDETQDLLAQPKAVEAQTQRIAALAEEVVCNIGEIVWANNPRYDTLADLVAFLREYAANYLSAASLPCRLNFAEAPMARTVPGPFRQHLLAVVKEALHNIVKHAQATEVEVTLLLNNEHMDLTIKDNGTGVEHARPFGNGLTNIRERLTELGGRMDLDSRPGHGTQLSVHVPLPSAHLGTLITPA